MSILVEAASTDWREIAKTVFKALLFILVVAGWLYGRYRTRLGWSMRHDLLEKSKVQTLFGNQRDRDQQNGPKDPP